MQYLAFLLLVCGIAWAAPVIDNTKAPAPAENRFPSTSYVHNLKRVPPPQADHSTWNSFALPRTRSTSSIASNFTTTLSTTVQPGLKDFNGLIYTARVAIGNQSFKLMIDTGSSDTWVEGLNTKGTFIPLDQHLNIGYLDSTWIKGVFGMDSLTIAGITVPAQQIAVAQEGNATEGSVWDGMLGLSFPAITRAYRGSNHSVDHEDLDHLAYSPLIRTIFDNGNSIPWLFSLALNRNPLAIENNGGVLVIGGVPDSSETAINTTSSLSSTPMVKPEIDYTIAVDSITYGSDTLDAETYWIVDSGTTLMWISAASATALYSQFNPPGTLVNDSLYLVDCNAVSPRVVVTITGQNFAINPADMILEPGSNGSCVGGIQPSISSHNILGTTFLKNVLAVFDWSKGEISFGAREYYSS